MDMSALFGSISAGLSQQFGGPYWAGQILGQGTPGHIDDDGNYVPGSAGTAIDCMVQVDQATEAMRQTAGFTDEDRRMLVLASPTITSITTDNRINITDGPFVGEWLIASVARDPFAAYWELRGRRA